MSELAKCTSWLGHKFEPRYSTNQPPNLTVEQIEAIGCYLISGEDNITRAGRTYECDICVRCGAAVQKPTPEPK